MKRAQKKICAGIGLEISKADLRSAMLLLEAEEQIETAKELLRQIETYVQGRL